MPCADILGRATFKVASPNVYYVTPQSSPRLVFGSTECIQQRAECQWSPLVEFVRTAEPRARCAVDPCLQFVAQVALCRGRQCSCHFKLIGNTFLFQSLSFVLLTGCLHSFSFATLVSGLRISMVSLKVAVRGLKRHHLARRTWISGPSA